MFVLPLPDFFQELLAGAERSLQAMFARSYGRLYMQHARLFQGLFVELHRHLKGSRPGLDEALSDFWSQLLERMLPLLNPQYSFPEGYLECVGRQVESLHAFGDSPRQLRVQVSPAPTRTALQVSEAPYLLWLEADPLAAGWEGGAGTVPLTAAWQGGPRPERAKRGKSWCAPFPLCPSARSAPHPVSPHDVSVHTLSSVKHSFRR